MRRLLDRIYAATGYLAALCVALIFVVMLGAAVMRELGMKTGGTDDIVSWLTAAAAFIGLAHTFKHGDFVRMSLLLDALGARRRRAFEILSLAIATAFCGYLAWSIAAFVYDSYRFNDMANGLIVIPLWIPQSSLVLGSILLFVAVLDEFLVVLRGYTPSYQRAIEERHARGDFSEDV